MRSRINRRLRWGASRVVSRIRRLGVYVLKPDGVDNLLASVPTQVARTDLSGQVAIVTGSTRGIGFVVAKALAEAQAKVVVNGRTADGVEEAAQAIRDAGGEVIGACADISTHMGAQQLMDAAMRAFGRLDILINNAAVLGPWKRRAWEVTPTEWQDVMAVNLNGAFLCAREAASCMVKHGIAGRIINVSSGGARTPVPGLSPYIVSKVGLEALTRTMALDAGWSGLTVCGIELGTYQTQMSRSLFSWDEFQLLPPPEMVLPVFLHVVTVPRERVQGRILAAWRFDQDTGGETMLAGPLSSTARAVFPPLRKGDQEVSRFDSSIVALDRAENPYGMPAKVREVLHRVAQEANFARYPDEQYPALRQALSARLKLSEACFTFASGSTELVERAVRTFVQAGEEVISNDPSWFMFDRFADIAGAINCKVPFKHAGSNGSFDHNLEAVAQAIGVNTRLIYLVNPSNPVGVGISTEAFRRFLDQVPAHIPIVVDEAYVEYSSRPETLRSHEVVLQTDRLVIGLRTFSKFYGLAALRIGYAFAAPETLRLFNRLEPLFVLSSLAEKAAIAALEDDGHEAWTLENLHRERVRIEERLSVAGFDYVPSEISFMLVACPGPPDKVYQAFAEEGIFIPKGTVMDRYMVFPIAQPSQNDKNLDILCSV